MNEVMPYVDYFFPSLPADTEVLFGTSDPQETIKAALDKGVQVVAVKMGEKGAVIGTQEEVIEIPPHTPGQVVDTTGAGDAFNGGFLHGTLNSMTPRDAATLGSIAAGLKVRGRGRWLCLCLDLLRLSVLSCPGVQLGRFG